MGVDGYLRQSMAATIQPFLPPVHQWFDGPEDAVVWLSVFRVFRIPYDTRDVNGRLAEFGQVRAVFTNVNLPYPVSTLGSIRCLMARCDRKASWSGGMLRTAVFC